MDFFEHQSVAKKKTGQLTVLFIFAVIGILIAVNAAAFVAVQLGAGYTESALVQSWASPKLFFVTTLSVLAVVLSGTLYKTLSLRSGGRVVAESLGARLLEPGSVDPQERRLLNVVEEMAIASGVPVPPVYVMDDETSINAFAAGFESSDAVIGMTRGSMEKLSRDELQGVVAHEFSHVFNGDMGLNLRLIGVLHGILVIGLIGQVVLRVVAHSGGGRSRRRSREGGGGGGGVVVGILVFGAALAVIGWIGTVFGNLIQSAVSRQREYLADASAVQYTRNPAGISGALKKIGGLPMGSRVRTAGATEIQHMLFGAGMKRGLTSLFATHPPLPERIRRIEPRFDGEFPKLEADFQSPYAEGGAYSAMAGAPNVSRKAADDAEAQQVEARRVAESTEAAVALVGRPTADHVARARELIDGLPAEVRDAAREPYGARAVVYALLLGEDPTLRDVQRVILKGKADPDVFELTERLDPLVGAIDPAARLPLLDLALPALRELSKPQYEAFVDNIAALIRADEQLDTFEWVLRRVLLRHLTPNFDAAPPARPVQFYGLQRLEKPCSLFLSTLARVGHDDDELAQAAFAAGAARLPNVTPRWLPREQCGVLALGGALDVLDTVSAHLKRNLLEAGGLTIAHDHEVTVPEAEMFRAVADSLGCPVPPLLPGQALA